MDLASVAEELYGLPPSGFTAARDSQAAAAKSSGDVELTKAIKQLRRPTTSAWLANLLVRRAAGEVDRLLVLGDDMRRAQSKLEAKEMRPWQTRDGSSSPHLRKMRRTWLPAPERGQRLEYQGTSGDTRGRRLGSCGFRVASVRKPHQGSRVLGIRSRRSHRRRRHPSGETDWPQRRRLPPKRVPLAGNRNRSPRPRRPSDARRNAIKPN